jgi:hypothetical protein
VLPNQINLSWTDNSTNETFFWVGRKKSTETSYALVAVASANSVTFSDVSLPPAAYDYRVWAYRGPTASIPSNVASATIPDGSDTIVPTTPTSLVATATSPTQAQLQWTASTDNVGIHHYRIERLSSAGTVQIDTTGNATSLMDSVTSGVAYRYRVRAMDAAGNVSGYSNADLATMIIFAEDPLVQGLSTVKAQHFDQLRQAVNAVRAAAGLSVASWTDPSLLGVVIRAVHLQELRDRLSPALTMLGFSAPSYTDTTLTVGSTLVKKVHIQELRDYVKRRPGSSSGQD